MKRLRILVSLTNNDNDYQQEQAAAAEKAARRLGVDVKIIHADNDAVAQSQQLLLLLLGIGMMVGGAMSGSDPIGASTGSEERSLKTNHTGAQATTD